MTVRSQQPNRFPRSLRLLIGLLFLQSASALFGGGMLLADPSGEALQMHLSDLIATPFRDYWVPGAILFGLLGLGPLLELYALWQQPQWDWLNRINPCKELHWSWTGSVLMGLALLGWIGIQVAMIGYKSFLQPLYAAIAVAILLLTFQPSTRKALEVPTGKFK